MSEKNKDQQLDQQLNEIQGYINKLTVEKKPIDPSSFYEEIVYSRSKEAATEGQSDVLKMIAKLGKDLIKLKESGAPQETYSLPLKNSTHGSDWRLELMTEGTGDKIAQVILLTEDASRPRPSFTRYRSVNVEEYLRINKAYLTNETEQEKIRSYAAKDGSIFVQTNINGKPEAATNSVSTFVWNISYKTRHDTMQHINHSSGDQYKEFTEEDELKNALNEVSNQFAYPLENFIPTALAHFKQAVNNADQN